MEGPKIMSKDNPGSVCEALARVQSFLSEGRSDKAIEFLSRLGMGNPDLSNAYGVCLMRAGALDKAVEVYQNLCLNGSVCVKLNASTLHLANYATALLLKGNLSGCWAVLRQARDPSHPAVRRVQDAIQHWRRSLSWIQRLRMTLTDHPPGKPVDLGFEPGELMGSSES
jgi:hypothetical protein